VLATRAKARQDTSNEDQVRDHQRHRAKGVVR
jgi:hypothetical protein